MSRMKSVGRAMSTCSFIAMARNYRRRLDRQYSHPEPKLLARVILSKAKDLTFPLVITRVRGCEIIGLGRGPSVRAGPAMPVRLGMTASLDEERLYTRRSAELA
jgi:hypothetical protein